MTQLKAIIAAGTLTGIILVTAIAFGVRGVNALADQNTSGTTGSAPVITQSDEGLAFGNAQVDTSFDDDEYEEHEYEHQEWDDD